MKLGIVVSAQPVQFEAVAFKGDFERHIEQVAALGYDGVELAVRDPAALDLAALARAVAASGLRVPAIGTGQAWGEERLSFTAVEAAVRAQAVARLRSHIALAARFGAVVIIGLIRGVVPPGVRRDAAWAWLVEALQRSAEAAAEAGVSLVVEPINRYETDLVNTVDEGLDLLKQVGADNVGLLPDTFHMNIEEPVIADSLRRAAPRLRHFHVADSNRWYPGAGHIDFPALLATLRGELGYDGWVSAEILPKPDALTAAERALVNLRGWLP